MQNPLLEPGTLAPFDRIAADHVGPAIDVLLADGQKAIDAVALDATPPSYGNTLGALDRATENLEWAQTVVDHLESVATTPALREAHTAMQPKTSAFYANIPLDARLYQRLRAFASTSEAAGLDPTRRRFLDKRLADLRRHGAELPDAGKERIRAIDVELAEQTTAFSQRVLDATNAFEIVVEEARTAGLPDSAKRAARTEDGRFRFTLHQPSIVPVLTYAEDRSLRETLWRASNTRASSGELDNRACIERILQLRAEKARILGFSTFADFVLEDRMAKSGARANAFVDALRARTAPAFEREREALTAFRTELGHDDGPMMPWDVGFYSERLRKARFDFDGEALRPYFAADRVLAGIFSLATELFGITVTPCEAPVWHPEVRTFAVREGARTLAYFYVDLHPRPAKRGGAWMNPIRTGARGAADEPHVGLFCANATPPMDGAPALLSHDEVLTLLHEFGHLLHHALSEVEVRSLAGTNVAWDFVELPSQIMENFGWERSALDRFARHYETDVPIPDELFSRMRAARTFRAATFQMRQLSFAAVDLYLHTAYRPEVDGDAVTTARRIMQGYAPTEFPADYAMICSFTHLFGSAVGYAAGYYSYKWAEVLDADCFTRFASGDPEAGPAFRREVLARGDSADPSELVRRFLGREPSEDALLARLGLL